MQLLKTLYRIYSPSGKEDKMKKYLIPYVKKIQGTSVKCDKKGNLYITKGKSETYPLIVAHIDQVSNKHSSDFKAIETRDIILGYSMKDRMTQNLGADDKNGVWIALKCLEKYDDLKIAFFVEEETGCGGSENADMSFFDDCRFVIQCDRRGSSDLITSIGFTDLCSEEFVNDIEPERYGYMEKEGMMTDVLTLKENGLGVSCINISCGYYEPHSEHEYTVKKDLQKCLRFVEHIIEDCTKIYPHEPSYNGYNGYYGYEVEDEIWAMLEEYPDTTPEELYDYYHEFYPSLTLCSVRSILDNFKFFYDNEEELTGKITYELKPNINGNKKDDNQLLEHTK